MRTQEEILQRIKDRQQDDILGFEWPYYVDALFYEHAKQFLKPEYDASDWNTKTIDRIRQEATDYMPFAWGKANDCRGISAGRSISHYVAWLWLLGEDFDDIEEYEFYGKSELIRICEYLNIDHAQYDDGVRVNTG